MGICISNSTCMKESLATLEDNSNYSISPFSHFEDFKMDQFNLNLPEKNSVKTNFQIEIKELAIINRPMLRRSLTAQENPQTPAETPKNSSLMRKLSRANSIIQSSLKKSSFLSKAKQKLRRMTIQNFENSIKDDDLSQESTEGCANSNASDAINELNYLRLHHGDIDPEAN